MVAFKPHIGKNVIETLTLGMYEDARFIFREYIQNAADQIDEAVELGILNSRADGEINIEIDAKNRKITITDNATGIKEENVLSFLGNVAASTKDPYSRKGFRGIGRLGGLGYCDKLKFETSYKGESVKSEMIMDAKLLKRMIADKRYAEDASTLISFITMIIDPPEAAAPKSHYFKVTLENVTNDDLLDIDSVRDYLSMVAPVPFKDDFGYGGVSFKDKIHEYFKDYHIDIDEYNVYINSNEKKLYKSYKPNIPDKNGIDKHQILDIDFFSIKNKKGKLIALAWYGISKYMNVKIQALVSGFRLRKGNIQIGSPNTLNRFFKEHRFNHHFIGEIYIIDGDFMPNARRDYFNDNETVQYFENMLRHKFKEFSRYAHDVSKIHNRFDDIKKFKEYEIPKKIRSRKEEKKIKEDFTKKREKAVFAQKELEKLYKKSETTQVIDVVLEHVIGEADLSIDNENKTIKKATKPPVLHKLNFQERKLIMEIFGIIEEELDIDQAEKLKEKIIERYT